MTKFKRTGKYRRPASKPVRRQMNRARRHMARVLAAQEQQQ